MKILRRNYRHRNLIIFLILSLVYLQAISSLSYGNTIFSKQSLHSFFKDHSLIIFLGLLSSYMILNIKKYSKLVLFLCLSIIVGKSFILLSTSFNKLTLGLNFIYLIFAFYFFISWELEVALASFNPLFSAQDLEKESRFKLQALVSLSENSEELLEVRITNIDEESCFLLLPENAQLKMKPFGRYYLTSYYEGVCFTHQARLVSSYDRGLGFSFENYKDIRLSWSELYKVCLERGFVS